MMKIIEDERMVEQYRFPRSKKKRIRKKWAKRPGNFRPSRDIISVGGHTLICHPCMAAELKAKMQPVIRAATQWFVPGQAMTVIGGTLMARLCLY